MQKLLEKTNSGKNGAEKMRGKKQENSNEFSIFEYVNSEYVQVLFGVSRQTLRNERYEQALHKIRYIEAPGRKYNFYDAAQLAYPYLSDLEIGILRVDITCRLKGKGKIYVTLEKEE